jgi:ParB-like chromosome segregation protein Spo0J
LIVVPRVGKYYVIDGHHRLGRARKNKNDSVECIVLSLPDKQVDDLEWFEKQLGKKLNHSSSEIVKVK